MKPIQLNFAKAPDTHVILNTKTEIATKKRMDKLFPWQNQLQTN